jgi:hypothetical protein
MGYGALLLIATCAGSVVSAAAQDGFLKQSHGANDPNDLDEWRKGEERGGLKAYPPSPPGAPNPVGGLQQFGGSGQTSFAGPDLPVPFAQFVSMMKAQRPKVDGDAHALLEARYRLDCVTDKSIAMSRGKPQPLGPAARLPNGVESWEALAGMPPEATRRPTPSRGLPARTGSPVRR